MSGKILIVGSSARAAVQSAVRNGFQPLAIDQFNDRDLVAICPAIRVADYPTGIVDLARRIPLCPFLYTGALENYPDVVATISRERPLLGNGPEILRDVRNPILLQRALLDCGLSSPELLQLGQSIPPGDWLSKPLRSGGGIGIRRISAKQSSQDRSSPFGVDQGETSGELQRARIVQRFVPGEPISALFLGNGREAKWLGATRQLVGCEWAGSDRFLYVGNIGPLNVWPNIATIFSRIGACLTQRFGLQGLFGVDAVLREDEVWVLEVNPRYTGAVEVLELATRLSPISMHVEACQGNRLPSTDFTADRICGKAILYSRRQLAIHNRFTEWSDERNAKSTIPVVTDLPATGSSIDRRQPICTVFAHGETITAVESSLQELAKVTYAAVEGTG